MSAPKAGATVRKIIWAVMLVLVAAAGLAVAQGESLRRLLQGDPKGWDYTWLRHGLDEAEEAAQATMRGARKASTRAAINALKQAIRYSRSSARSTGTEPIPADIRDQLEPYFDEDLLDDVRWAYSNQYIDLGSVISAWYRAEGGAVTLIDTIVYSSSYAAGRRFLWAHELTHVMQYRELGLDGFARVYVTNPHLLEQQAWDNARRIELAIQRDARRARVAAEASG